MADTMRPALVIFEFALIIRSPMACAADGHPSQPEAVTSASKPVSSEARADKALSDPKQFRGFFGYLEFDFDPGTPGGAAGFATLSELKQTTAEVQRD
jgi:hypothetical protein